MGTSTTTTCSLEQELARKAGELEVQRQMRKLQMTDITLGAIADRVVSKGQDILQMSEKDVQDLRGNEISMIFQEPMTSLNPVFRIGDQVDEVIALHDGEGKTKEEIRERTIEAIKMVGIANAEGVAEMFPHELSGGMRQRVMIACALCCRPKLLIADEPTTALDVTIQAQIMELIVNLNHELNMGVILITHDLSVVAETCSRVAVMYLGQIVEEADVLSLFEHPMHPYTRGLLKSIPSVSDGRREVHRLRDLGKPYGVRLASGLFADLAPARLLRRAFA